MSFSSYLLCWVLCLGDGGRLGSASSSEHSESSVVRDWPGDALLQQHEVGRRGRGGGRLRWSILGTLGILPVVLFPFLLRGHVAAKVACPDNDAT